MNIVYKLGIAGLFSILSASALAGDTGAMQFDRNEIGWSACSTKEASSFYRPGLPVLPPETLAQWLRAAVKLTPEQDGKIKQTVTDVMKKDAAVARIRQQFLAASHELGLKMGKTTNGAELQRLNDEDAKLAAAADAQIKKECGASDYNPYSEMRAKIDAVLTAEQQPEWQKKFAEKFAAAATTVRIQKKDKSVIEGPLLGIEYKKEMGFPAPAAYLVSTKTGEVLVQASEMVREQSRSVKPGLNAMQTDLFNPVARK